MARTMIEICSSLAEAQELARTATHPSKIVTIGPTNQLKILGLGLQQSLFTSGADEDYYVVISTPDTLVGPLESEP